jgi:hypothetical protein
MIISHGGFVTYPHKDGGGYNTWVYVHEGRKLWTYYRLQEHATACYHTVETDGIDVSPQSSPCSLAGRKDMFTIELNPGDTL